MICIVDYEAGNLRSVQKAVEHTGAEAKVTSNPKEILEADKVIFPGVGAFGKAVEKIDQLGLRDTLLESIEKGKPFLGICLGMQLLFESSEESPGVKGLSVFKGPVKRFTKISRYRIWAGMYSFPKLNHPCGIILLIRVSFILLIHIIFHLRIVKSLLVKPITACVYLLP